MQVLLELLAYPNTGDNRVVVDTATFAGTPSEGGEGASVCEVDNRTPQFNLRPARIMPIACTAFLFDGRPNCLLTAGHCCDLMDFQNTVPIVEFRVPSSLCNGTVRPAPEEHQYYVDELSVQFHHRGFFEPPGDDWCFFGVFNNVTDPQDPHSPLDAQGVTYQLAPTVPDPGGSVRITGYGIDFDPPGCDAPRGLGNAQSQSLQLSAGNYFELVPDQVEGSVLKFHAFVLGGNSGSAAKRILTDLVYAIVTHKTCEDGSDVAFGTAIDHPNLQTALANPLGICADCNDNGIPDPCDIDCSAGEGGCNVPGCGASTDCNLNAIPDDCEGYLDCDGNGIPDACELPFGGCCMADESCEMRAELTRSRRAAWVPGVAPAALCVRMTPARPCLFAPRPEAPARARNASRNGRRRGTSHPGPCCVARVSKKLPSEPRPSGSDPIVG